MLPSHVSLTVPITSAVTLIFAFPHSIDWIHVSSRRIPKDSHQRHTFRHNSIKSFLQPQDENSYALKDNILFRRSFVTKMLSDKFELAVGRRNRPIQLAAQTKDLRFLGRGVLVRFSNAARVLIGSAWLPSKDLVDKALHVFESCRQPYIEITFAG